MKAGKFSFAPIPALIGLSIAALVGWAVSHFSGLGFWPAFAIVVVSMFINGIVAEAEDNEPGGFNNPLPSDKDKTPPNDANDNTRNA